MKSDSGLELSLLKYCFVHPNLAQTVHTLNVDRNVHLNGFSKYEKKEVVCYMKM